MDRNHLFQQVQIYAERKNLTLGGQLGFGIHGSVYSTENQIERGRSAIKAHEQESAYFRERDIYLRLQELGIAEIRGCNVPELIDWDDDLWIIEMSIVFQPYVLDFAGAYLDRPLDFSEEVMADWHVAKQDQFGDRWPEVQKILGVLETYGIYMEDVNTGNISFLD